MEKPFISKIPSPKPLAALYRAVLLLVFAFIGYGFRSYQPGNQTLLSQLTGAVLLLTWCAYFLLLIRTFDTQSVPTKVKASDIRETPWEGMKSLLKFGCMLFGSFGLMYLGLNGFGSEKTIYWSVGRYGPYLYVFWSDSPLLAFATATSWFFFGFLSFLASFRAFFVTNKWR